MKIGPRPDATEPGIQCVRTYWNRGDSLRQNLLEPGTHCVRTHWNGDSLRFNRPGAPGP
jgi:hypothetical protein